MLQARYRKDYEGEFIITRSTWSGGKKTQEREWIANPIENHHISGRAICIGSEDDCDWFDYTILQRHRGGLLGSKKLQTYGVSDIAKNMRLDFALETDAGSLKNLVDTGYHENNIVYTTPRNCLSWPGFFYTIPYNPLLCKEAMLVYLAAFDGHQEVFLLGYNTATSVGQSTWIDQVSQIFKTYTSVQFSVVCRPHMTPLPWLEYPNVRNLDLREFISYADI